MLEILAQAQAAGQKEQQDALLGQGSIFDLDPPPGPGAAAASPFMQVEPPVPALEDDRKELAAMEKETLGLFLSSHPIKEVRAALNKRVDCSLAELARKKDGEWVTVGGVIAECKRIRTKKGEPMMFAKLDDLEGQVEMLVFNSAYAQNADKVDADRVLIVRGRVDHKDQGETKLVAQEVEIFEPTREEVESAREEAAVPAVARRLSVTVDGSVGASFLEELKDVVSHFPGDHEVVVSIGDRTLRLGDGFRVSGCNACRADLEALAGAALVAV